MIRAVIVRTECKGLRDLAGLRVEVDVAFVLFRHVVEDRGCAQQLAILRNVLGDRRQRDLVARVDQERQVRPLFAEILIPRNLRVQFVVDDVLHPTEHHGHVGTRFDGQPHVRLRRIGIEARVDDDGLATVRTEFRHAAAGRRRRMPRRAGAPHDVNLGDAAVLGRLVQLRAAGVGDGRVAQAVDERHRVVARQVALRAAGLEHVAGTPEVAETRRAEELRVAATARGAEQAVLAGLVAHVDQVLGDGLGRLFPANALPLVAGLFAHTLHGVLVAVRMVECLHARKALRADTALRHRVDRVAFNLDDAAIAHHGDDTAVRDAGAAGRANLRHLAFGPSLIAGRKAVRSLNAQSGRSARCGSGLHERTARHVR